MMSGLAVPRPPDAASHFLVLLFLTGTYLGISAHLPGNVPVPGVLAGAAGCLMLMAEAGRARESHLVAIIAIMVLYALSIIAAPDYRFLGERFKGLIQITYSLLIGYAAFLVLIRFRGSQLASIFLTFAILILIGCALENFTAFRDISDAFRAWVFETGVYKADLRDQVFYGLIRPKLFTSEPSAVAFMFALFSFSWYVLSVRRGKIFIYAALIAAGYFLMRGPSLLLAVALIPAYELTLGARRGPPGNVHLDAGRFAGTFILAALVLAAAIPLIQALYAARLQAIVSGEDPSFFSRIIAPPLVALKVIAAHPATGAGLTGWEFIDAPTRAVYANAKWLSTDYRFPDAAHAITNYFWLHWIYLGLLWGSVLAVALSVLLRCLAVPSVLFCWIVWAVFGQGAGSYVGPQAWFVFFLSAALSVIYERERAQRLFEHIQMRHRRAAVAREPRLMMPSMARGAG